jgi:hypothetical protein
VIEAIGLNPGTLQRRANLLAQELGHLYDLKELPIKNRAKNRAKKT